MSLHFANNRPDNAVTPTILMVEDEPLLLDTIAECLREWGYRVLQASDGGAAIAVLKSAPCRISLVFSDIRMPGRVDGFDLARWVRARHPDMRVLLTSGYAGPVSVQTQTLHDGPILRKPYDLRTLRARLAQLMPASDAPQTRQTA